jgi:hypothetical protein
MKTLGSLASAEIAPHGFHLGELFHQLTDVLSLKFVDLTRTNEVLELLKSYFQQKGLKVANLALPSISDIARSI